MLKIVILLLTIISVSIAWDYFLFVQLWPTSWLTNSNITGYNFTDSYYSIHGIWPNDYNASYPQFCNTSSGFNSTILDPISNNLTLYWTDFKNATNFWQHEYLKHMTCINETNLIGDYKYFWDGLNLRESLNLYSALSRFNITPTNNHYYALNDIMYAIKKTYGSNVVITCTNNSIIEEVRFCMNKDFQLFDCPQNEYNEACRNKYLLYSYYDF